MSIFLTIFLSLYGGMHYYAYRKFRTLYHPAPITIALLIITTCAPLLVRWAELNGRDELARLIAWPGYIWMGGLFLLCTLFATLDMLRCGLWIMAHFLNVSFLSRRAAPSRITSIAVVLMAGCATAYACLEARMIRSEHLTITSNTPLPQPLRIVQISDVHLGLLTGAARVQAIVDKVREAKPDILVSTGDLLDGRLSRNNQRQNLYQVADLLGTISAPQGKFAIPGNHEYYAGIDAACELTSRAGFTMLRNSTVQLPVGITITGIDDPAAQQNNLLPAANEIAQVKQLPPTLFHLLLKHRPTLEPSSNGLINLQLSGHTHKGQLLPFYPLTWLKFPLRCGTTTTSQGTMIHVSRGTGTWGPPMRFLAPPEITVIDIVGKPFQKP